MSRRNLIKLVTFLGGLYYFLGFVLPKSFLGFEIDKYDDQISNGFIAIGAVAIGLGLINILMAHGSRLIFKRKGWFDSLALLLGLIAMTAVSALDWRAGVQISKRSDRFFNLRDFALKIDADQKNRSEELRSWQSRELILIGEVRKLINTSTAELGAIDLANLPKDVPVSEQIRTSRSDLISKLTELNSTLVLIEQKANSNDVTATEQNQQLGAVLGQAGAMQLELSNAQYQLSDLKQIYRVFYDGLSVALGSAMFALLGFYIASAAYRAFRLQSMESGLMLGAALLVMLGQIPFGLWIWDGLPEVRLWILEVPNSAAFRAVKFGAAVAGLVMAFRMWLSIESSSFGSKEQ